MALTDAHVAGHPFSAATMRELGWRAEPLSQEQMQARLASASYVLAPAGLTTTLEAASRHTPLAFLPETEYSHRSNYELLTANNLGTYPAVRLTGRFGLPQQPSTEDFDRVYRHLISDAGGGELNILQAQLADVLAALSDPDSARALADAQLAVVLELVGTFDGAQEIAAITRDSLM